MEEHRSNPMPKPRYTYIPDSTFFLDRPSQVVFPDHSPSEYASGVYKTMNLGMALNVCEPVEIPEKPITFHVAFLAFEGRPTLSCQNGLLLTLMLLQIKLSWWLGIDYCSLFLLFVQITSRLLMKGCLPHKNRRVTRLPIAQVAKNLKLGFEDIMQLISNHVLQSTPDIWDTACTFLLDHEAMVELASMSYSTKNKNSDVASKDFTSQNVLEKTLQRSECSIPASLVP